MLVSEKKSIESPRTLKCPQCGKTKTLPVTLGETRRKTLKVKCPCGTVFAIPLDQRTFPRKRVTLIGSLFIASTQPADMRTCIGKIHIHCLSLGGISFNTISTSHMGSEHTFAVGDHYIVAFTLNDAVKTTLEANIRICHVYGRAIGAAFVDDAPYSYDLDFYLTS